MNKLGLHFFQASKRLLHRRRIKWREMTAYIVDARLKAQKSRSAESFLPHNKSKEYGYEIFEHVAPRRNGGVEHLLVHVGSD